MAEEKKAMENKQPIEAEGKVVKKEKANKEKILVRAGKKIKKIACSKPVKILGRTLVVAGSALGAAAFFKNGSSDSPVSLDMLDTPAFPDTSMAEIPTMESADVTTEE